MRRRNFIKTGFAAGIGLGFSSVGLANVHPARTAIVKPVTFGPKHHFFGYYGISPWNRSGTYLLGLEVERQDSMPDEGEKASIGIIDTQTNKFQKIADTGAWNYQQGAMLHWNPLDPDVEIYFNDKIDNQIVTRKLNVHTGRESIMPRPINGLSHNGKYALSLDYGRLGRLRKVVGYSGVIDKNANDPAPKDGGIWLMDMQTGKSTLVVSYHQVYDYLKNRGVDFKGAHMWFNHVVFNKTDTRFFFLARTPYPGEEHGHDRRETGMFTVNIDGSQLFEAIPYGYDVSHFDWQDDKNIIATFKNKAIGAENRSHYMFTDGSNNFTHLGEGRLDFDGHCVFAPDGTWIATDQKKTVEGGYFQSLHIYNIKTKEFNTLFTHDLKRLIFRTGDLRCDFHPRWNKTGDKICIDSIDQTDGTRQIHIVSLKD
jgi:hypothetical protein